MNSATPTNNPEAHYRVSLKAVIRNDQGEVLVVKEGNAKRWSLPGGGIDHGETHFEALERELHEELGYVGGLASVAIKGAIGFYVPRHQTWAQWIVYEVETNTMEFKVGEHATEIAFKDPVLFKDSDGRGEQLVYKFCVDPDAPFDVFGTVTNAR